MQKRNFEVVSAANVTDALSLIVTQPFDVLITDLHMPGTGDGFTLMSAMHHVQPQALTLVLSGYPDIEKAMDAIVLQADQILVKPVATTQLAEVIAQKTQDRMPSARPTVVPVASILERCASDTIERWLARVQKKTRMGSVVLDDD